MNFFCNGCEQDRDFDTDYGILIITLRDGIKRFCRSCRKPTAAAPDVFWDGKPEENLADDPNTGKARVFSSKSEKAAYLKERGIMEAGDRVHGAPVMIHQNQNRKTDSRPQVQEAIRRAMQMSPDRRRQEFLKIRKEGQRYA